ncbi:C-type lectin domain family 4 member F-like [Hydractinia symbiolongicarpus]|uniref:C-type lectin domain family 4 member F-like n=1 Tax=Hydractinia symbiolongicarpus TaxID=13093 RepID=UPI0025501125|nr:C-type lectin domain family 4 member F-like [Hydractinia symbiolongicarpus]
MTFISFYLQLVHWTQRVKTNWTKQKGSKNQPIKLSEKQGSVVKAVSNHSRINNVEEKYNEHRQNMQKSYLFNIVKMEMNVIEDEGDTSFNYGKLKKPKRKNQSQQSHNYFYLLAALTIFAFVLIIIALILISLLKVGVIVPNETQSLKAKMQDEAFLIHDMAKRIDKQEQSISILQHQIDKKSRKISRLENQLSNMQQKISPIGDMLIHLNEEIKTLNMTKAGIMQKVNIQNNSMENLNKQVESLKTIEKKQNMDIYNLTIKFVNYISYEKLFYIDNALHPVVAQITEKVLILVNATFFLKQENQDINRNIANFISHSNNTIKSFKWSILCSSTSAQQGCAGVTVLQGEDKKQNNKLLEAEKKVNETIFALQQNVNETRAYDATLDKQNTMVRLKYFATVQNRHIDSFYNLIIELKKQMNESVNTTKTLQNSIKVLEFQQVNTSAGFRTEINGLKTKVKDYNFDLVAKLSYTRYNDSMYVFSRTKKTWLDAERYCISVNGHLASILSADENAFLKTQMNNRRDESEFKWSDGSSVTYKNWDAGEPNNLRNEDCASMLKSGLWNDLFCSSKEEYFVCKMSS